ncbi:transmembrane protein [Ceratobasidium sp. AG-Ba]|nr:transmembrane protein [Ceratobasidium sp. AG-Ba]
MDRSSKRRLVHEIVLPGFDFFDERIPQDQINGSHTARPPSFRLGYDSKGFDIYERMDLDKPGSELTPDATIWTLYVEEAAKYDKTLVEARQRTVNTFLLFTTMFSVTIGILSFVIKTVLQQDPHIMDTLSPSQSALTSQWIIGALFISISLSLSVVLVTVLAKAQLAAFMTARPNAPHAYTLDRQSRLEALERWWSLHMNSLLPSLLAFSLISFSIVPILYLWGLDTTFTSAVGAIVGLNMYLYINSTRPAASSDIRPFVTKVLGSFRKASKTSLLHRDDPSGQTCGAPTQKHLEALLWLASNSQDPTIVDCTYQSLAGFYIGPPGLSNAQKLPKGLSSGLERLAHGVLTDTPSDIDIDSLLSVLLARFKRILSDSRYLASAPHTAILRYTNAILALASASDSSCSVPVTNSANFQTLPAREPTVSMLMSLLEPLSNPSVPKIKNTSTVPISVYAALLISESRFLLAAASSFLIKPQLNTASPEKTDPDVGSHIVIDAEKSPNNPAGSDSEETRRNLRAHYSRWLVRTTAFLRLHSESRITIDESLLQDLLALISEAMQLEVLNPSDSMSTHHPQSTIPQGDEFYFIVPFNGDFPYVIWPEYLVQGLLGTLVNLLRQRPGAFAGSSVQTVLAILKAYASSAPVILGQAFGTEYFEQLSVMINFENWDYAPVTDIFGLRYICARLILITIRCIGSSDPVNYEIHFCEKLLDLLLSCTDEDSRCASTGGGAFCALAHYGDSLAPLLEFIGEEESNLSLISGDFKMILLDLARISHTAKGEEWANLCDTMLTPKSFVALLSMLESSGHPSDNNLGMLLWAMFRRMRNGSPSHITDTAWNDIPAIEYLREFTHTSSGFSAIVSAGSKPEYQHLVTQFTNDVVCLAAGNDPLFTVCPVEIDDVAVFGFLKVVGMMSQCYLSGKVPDEAFCRFAANALDLLNAAASSESSKTLLYQSSALRDLWDALEEAGGQDEAEELLTRLSSFAWEFGIYHGNKTGHHGSSASPGLLENTVEDEDNTLESGSQQGSMET